MWKKRKSVSHIDTYQRIDLHKKMCYARFEISVALYTSCSVLENRKNGSGTWRDNNK